MFKRILDEKFIESSFIVLFFNFLVGALNYVYQMIIGRILSPEEFGAFISLVSITYFLGILSMTINISITNIASKLIAENKPVYGLIIYSMKNLIRIAMISTLLFFLAYKPISSFLKIYEFEYFVTISIILFIGFLLPIFLGILRAMYKFFEIGIFSTIASLTKLILGIFLTKFLKVLGALIGFVSFGLVSIILSSLYVFKKIKKEIYYENFKILSYSIPVLVANIFLTFPSNIDMLIAKHILSNYEAGIYASLTIFGKIVFFVSYPIASALFPYASRLYYEKGNYIKVLLQSILIASLLASLVIFVYWKYPDIVIKIFNEKYKEATNYLLSYGAAMMFFSISALFLNFCLAIRYYAQVIIFSSIVLSYIILIYFFSKNIYDIVTLFLLGNFILFLISFFSLIILWKKHSNL